jgi:hypothetical protein
MCKSTAFHQTRLRSLQVSWKESTVHVMHMSSVIKRLIDSRQSDVKFEPQEPSLSLQNECWQQSTTGFHAEPSTRVRPYVCIHISACLLDVRT